MFLKGYMISKYFCISSLVIKLYNSVEEQVAPLSQIVTDINRSNQEIEEKTANLLNMLGQLRGTTPEAQEELDKFLEEFEG